MHTAWYKFAAIHDDWHGHTTINGLQLTNNFIYKFCEQLDERYRCVIAIICGSNWLDIRIALFINTIIGTWIVMSIWTALNSQINAGILALIIANGIEVVPFKISF